MLGNLKATSMKAPFRVNSFDGVTAVVTSVDLENALIEWNRFIHTGLVGEMQPPILLCKPTFTYAPEGKKWQAHTGTDHQHDLVIGKLLNRMYKQEQIWNPEDPNDEKILKEATDKLCERDQRIYIPFASSKFDRLWLELPKLSAIEAEDHLTEHMENLGLIT